MSKLLSYLEKLIVKIPKANKDYKQKTDELRKQEEIIKKDFAKKNKEAIIILNREQGIKLKVIAKNNDKKDEILYYKFDGDKIDIDGHGNEINFDIKKPLIGKIDNVYKKIDKDDKLKIYYNVEFTVYTPRQLNTTSAYGDAGVRTIHEPQKYRIEFIYESDKLVMTNIIFIYYHDDYEDEDEDENAGIYEFVLELPVEDYDVKIYSDNEFSNDFLKTVSSKLEPNINEDTTKNIFGFVGQSVRNKSKSKSKGGKKTTKKYRK